MDESKEHFVIIGTGAGACGAHEELRKKGFDGPVTMIGREHQPPYMRPPLSKMSLTSETRPEAKSIELTEHAATKLKLGVEVTGIDVETRTLHTSDGEVSYDKLIIATGGDAICPKPWRDAGALTLRSYDDLVAIWERAQNAKSAIVIGGGFIGTEVASGLRQRGLEVTIIAADKQLLPASLTAGGEIVESIHKAAGIHLHLGVMVDTVTAVKNSGVNVTTKDGDSISADMLVVGIGVSPATSFLRDSTLTLDERGAVLAGDDLIALGSNDTIAVAGDIALAPHPLAEGESVRVEHWFWAYGQGAHAARSLLGERSGFRDMPVFGSMQSGTKVFVQGLPQFGQETLVKKELTGTPLLVARFDRADGTLVGTVTVNADDDQLTLRGELMKTLQNS